MNYFIYYIILRSIFLYIDYFVLRAKFSLKGIKIRPVGVRHFVEQVLSSKSTLLRLDPPAWF